jgi:glucose-6-phosphate 1-dehydrogenase
MHPDDIRDEKTKLIRSLRTVQDEDIVVAQYTAANGKPGYTDDDGVPNNSLTPTYCAVRLWCDNERWEGVPMVIKAGMQFTVSSSLLLRVVMFILANSAKHVTATSTALPVCAVLAQHCFAMEGCLCNLAVHLCAYMH